MSSQHCPYCNGTTFSALGSVALTDNVVVEHYCCTCSRLFSITDRRIAKQSTAASEESISEDSTEEDSSSSFTQRELN